MSRPAADNRGDIKRMMGRSDAVVQRLQTDLEETRWRLATLEAWILDKEHTGLIVRVLLQNMTSNKFLDADGQWRDERDSAFTLATTLNAVHYCQKEKLHHVRLVLEVQRTSGAAFIPVELPGLKD